MPNHCFSHIDNDAVSCDDVFGIRESEKSSVTSSLGEMSNQIV